MKIEIVYVYPTVGGPQYDELAGRFLNSYHQNPPLVQHSTTLVLNGGKRADDISPLFHTMPGLKIFEHDNSGWELGAYQQVSRVSDADMVAFFASSTFFTKPGWLNRMAETFLGGTRDLYGAMGNRGDARVNVEPHIRTTAFWLNPSQLNAYPWKVCRPEHRYPFEHGKNCLTSWFYSQGQKVYVVTFNGIYEWAQWDDTGNGFHRGDQSGLLAWDRLCEPPYYPY